MSALPESWRKKKKSGLLPNQNLSLAGRMAIMTRHIDPVPHRIDRVWK
jgi:hypothetical protein